jgi:hypothetical protein
MAGFSTVATPNQLGQIMTQTRETIDKVRLSPQAHRAFG